MFTTQKLLVNGHLKKKSVFIESSSSSPSALFNS